MICSRRGSNIADNALFCTKCGYKIENPNVNSDGQVTTDLYSNAPMEIRTPTKIGSTTKQRELLSLCIHS